MAPPPLTATTRYIPEGTRKVYWVPTIAVQSAPTRAELNAGTDLTAEIFDVTGFTVTSNTIEVPDLSSRFTAKIPGLVVADDSALVCYASQTSNDVRTVLPRDTAGFVVILWEGDVSGQKMDVFPSKVVSTSILTPIADPARINVAIAVTKVPSQNVVIPP